MNWTESWTDGRTNEHTNGWTDERKEENYIPHGINAEGIIIVLRIHEIQSAKPLKFDLLLHKTIFMVN